MIHGSTEGLKKSTIEALEKIYELEIPRDKLWTEELITALASISGEINREISVYIDRKGKITDVSVGDYKTVELNEVEGRRSSQRLSGIRCIHTHLNGSGMLSAPDLSSLILLKLDMVAAVGVENGRATEIYAALPSAVEKEDYEIFGPFGKNKQDFSVLFDCIKEADEFLKRQSEFLDDNVEKAVLVGLKTQETRDINGVSEAEISMLELKELAQTAGAQVVATMMQKRSVRDSAYLIGKGKLEELKLLVQTKQTDLVIFDEEISPSQQRNIEEAVGVKIIDRTGLILDIFAQRARSREGKIQVELAQLEYNLPRIYGKGSILSRLGGGIGTRGPGETKLETDRRHIKRKITALREELKEIKKQRSLLRIERERNRVPVVSLVGYTNAGKSSLLNALCDADVYTENKLFATLDTTTRQLMLDENKLVLLSDTVGFIRKLPHNLLDAFKSTLEEAIYSDALIIVADASDPYAEDHLRIVDNILNELGAGAKPAIIACNKIDKVQDKNFRITDDRIVIETSAITGEGLDKLKACLKEILFTSLLKLSLKIPFSEGWVLPWLYENGTVLSVDYDENSSLVEVEIDNSLIGRIKKFISVGNNES